MNCRSLLLLFLASASPLYCSEVTQVITNEILEQIWDLADAISKTDIDTVKRLISKELVNLGPSNESSPLYLSAEQNNEELVKLCLANGADPTKNSSAALRIACQNGNPKIMQLLIEAGANVNDTNHKGHTMLHSIFDPTPVTRFERLMKLPKKKAAISLLLEHGAQLEAVDKDMRTPYLVLYENLFLCNWKRRDLIEEILIAEIVELGDSLLNHGTYIDTQDKMGYTVMNYLADFQYEALFTNNNLNSCSFRPLKDNKLFLTTVILLQLSAHLNKRFLIDIARELKFGESRKKILTILCCMKFSPLTKKISKDVKGLVFKEIISTLKKDFILMIISAPLLANKKFIDKLGKQKENYTDELLIELFSLLRPSQEEQYKKINVEFQYDDLSDTSYEDSDYASDSDAVETIKTFWLKPALILSGLEAELTEFTTLNSLEPLLKKCLPLMGDLLNSITYPKIQSLLEKHVFKGEFLTKKDRFFLLFEWGEEKLGHPNQINNEEKSFFETYYVNPYGKFEFA